MYCTAWLIKGVPRFDPSAATKSTSTMQTQERQPRAETQRKANISSSASRSRTICGNASCECSRIMAHLDLIQTPYFTVNNPDKRLSPILPDQFVQEHGDEVKGTVVLDTARTAGRILTVQFVREEDEETGAIKSLRIAQPGWERFVARNKLQPEDLLFFTLQQGQARFIVLMIRGHGRSKSQRDLDLEEGTAELWRAAKKRKGSAHESGKDEDCSAVYVNCISSDDALGSYRMLGDDSDDSIDVDDFDSEGENCSDFEDESEFQSNLHHIKDIV